MRDHMGRRRKQSTLPIARLLILAAALVAIGWVLVLPEPPRPADAAAPTELGTVASWSGPAPTRAAGQLADGAVFQPRIYLTPLVSVGVAETTNGAYQRVILRMESGKTIELRRVASSSLPQFDGFAVSGDILVWAESISVGQAAVRTTIWRANWRTGAKPAAVTTNTGDANFFGGQYDLLVRNKRIYWAALGAGRAGGTEIRSVPLTGGQVTIQRLDGVFGLSSWPWVVSSGGRGSPVELYDLSKKQRIKVATSAAETATCGPRWCRMGVLQGNTVVRFDVQRPDGSERIRIAGDEATPSIVDVTLLDRFIPLTTDRSEADSEFGVGLSLYDLESRQTDLVATDVANVSGRGGMLWWSAGTDEDLVWYAIDLRALT